MSQVSVLMRSEPGEGKTSPTPDMNITAEIKTGQRGKLCGRGEPT